MNDFKNAFDVEVNYSPQDQIWNVEIDGNRVVDVEECGDGDSVLYAGEFEIAIDKAIELGLGNRLCVEINSAIDKLGLSFPEFRGLSSTGWAFRPPTSKYDIQRYIETVIDSETVSAWAFIAAIFGLTDADLQSAHEDAYEAY